MEQSTKERLQQVKSESKFIPFGTFYPMPINGKIFIATTPEGFKGGSLQVAEIVKWKSKRCTMAHTNLFSMAPEFYALAKETVSSIQDWLEDAEPTVEELADLRDDLNRLISKVEAK